MSTSDEQSNPPLPSTPPAPAESAFAGLGLSPQVLAAVLAVGYETPSPIQAAAIPVLLAGRDLVGQAQTGTGKTAAFALPLLSRLDLNDREPQILVLTPTRELAIQVAEAMSTYARKLDGFHILPVYGGQAMDVQLRPLRRGVHAVVGTPGRILDHLRRGTLRLDGLRSLVLDEADEMLRMGFLEDVETILDEAPTDAQIALFSATMPPPIVRIARKRLKDPVEIRIESATTTVAAVRQSWWEAPGAHKLDALTRILEVEDFDAMLVFVRTRIAAVELSEKLEARGFACGALHGDMTQPMREKTVERLRGGTLDIVVATDVAARGLDVDRISHVVNYDVPPDVESYVHRIGRTGRAGRSGQAILFVSPRERRLLEVIERSTGQKIERLRMPSRSDVVDRRVSQFKTAISEALASQDLEFFAEVIESYRAEHDVLPERIAAALAWIAQKERPLVPDLPDIPMPRVEKRPMRDDRPDRPDRPGRPDRPDHGDRPSGDRDAGPPLSEVQWRRFRVEVGRAQGVLPGNLVGAIANELGIASRYIGRIEIFDEWSAVELPGDLPPTMLSHLEGVVVRGRELRPSPLSDRPGERGPRVPGPWSRAPRPGGGPGGPGGGPGGRPPRPGRPPFGKR